MYSNMLMEMHVLCETIKYCALNTNKLCVLDKTVWSGSSTRFFSPPRTNHLYIRTPNERGIWQRNVIWRRNALLGWDFGMIFTLQYYINVEYKHTGWFLILSIKIAKVDHRLITRENGGGGGEGMQSCSIYATHITYICQHKSWMVHDLCT